MSKRWNIDSVKKFVKENSTCKLISTEYVNAKEKLDFICECGNEFSVSWDSYLRNNQRQCKWCGYKNGASKQSATIKQVEEKINGLYEIMNKNEFESLKTELILYHEECNHTFKRKGNKIMRGQLSCGFCSDSAILTDENAPYKLSLITDEFEYIGLIKEMHKDTKLVLKHKECGTIIERTLTQLRDSQGAFCPTCKNSKGSQAIEKYLNELNIKYIKEYKFKDCVYKKELPFDFYLPSYNCCIEFDGFQHFEAVKRWGGEEGLRIRQLRDKIKDDYCKNNNIKLIRISQKEYDNNVYLDKLNNMLIPS